MIKIMPLEDIREKDVPINVLITSIVEDIELYLNHRYETQQVLMEKAIYRFEESTGYWSLYVRVQIECAMEGHTEIGINPYYIMIGIGNKPEALTIDYVTLNKVNVIKNMEACPEDAEDCMTCPLIATTKCDIPIINSILKTNYSNKNLHTITETGHIDRYGFYKESNLKLMEAALSKKKRMAYSRRAKYHHVKLLNAQKNGDYEQPEEL